MKVVKLLFSESNAVFIFRDEKIKKESNDLPEKDCPAHFLVFDVSYVIVKSGHSLYV